MPLVSVIMSTFNEKTEYLQEAIESVLAQTYKDFEFLIILDNPKSQEIQECVQAYANQDPRIRIIINDKNIGLTSSLNKAIQAARGMYMFRMDADDIIMPECIEKELFVMKAEQLDFVAASKKNITEQGQELGAYINDFSPRQIRMLLPYDNSVNHPTVLVHLQLVKNEGGYRNIPACEDYDLWLRMLIHGRRMRIIPNVYLYRRMRTDGISNNNAYHQYRSKRFLMEMAKAGRKDRNIEKTYTCDAYKNFYINRDEKGMQDFNLMYDLLYMGFHNIKSRKLLKGMLQLWKAILADPDIRWILLDKIIYQLRKNIVIRFCR